MNYTIKPKIVGLFLGSVATLLAFQSLIGEFLLENVLLGESSSSVIFLIDLLSVNVEESIPTWFSTILLFIASLLLWFIWGVKNRKEDEWRTYWLGLAFVFLYLSIDEGAAIHETFVQPIESIVQTSGFFAFAWQIVFLPLVLIFVFIYIRFLRALPQETAVLFILSGVIYVGGAVFIEGWSANEWDINQGITFRYLMIATVEEWFEMMGASLFIYTLLDYIVVGNYTAVFQFAPTNATNAQIVGSSQGRNFVKIAIFVGLILNFWLIGWVFQVPGAASVVEDKRPFSQTIADEYGADGVVILQFSQAINATQAESLLNLFEDVLVLEEEPQTVTVFASNQLPFDEQSLLQQYPQLKETDLLNRSELNLIAEN